MFRCILHAEELRFVRTVNFILLTSVMRGCWRQSNVKHLCTKSFFALFFFVLFWHISRADCNGLKLSELWLSSHLCYVVWHGSFVTPCVTSSATDCHFEPPSQALHSLRLEVRNVRCYHTFVTTWFLIFDKLSDYAVHSRISVTLRYASFLNTVSVEYCMPAFQEMLERSLALNCLSVLCGIA